MSGASAQRPIRRGLSRPLLIGIGSLVLLGGYCGYQWWQARRPPGPLLFASPSASLSPHDLPGMQTGAPPWGTDLGTLRARLEADGIPVLAHEETATHFHLHLDLFVDGSEVTVPANIGFDPDIGVISPVHTHDTSGIVHVESPSGLTYSLGQLFDVWGVRFDGTCLGECGAGDRRVRVFADGTPLQQDPRLLILGRHQEIVVTLGTGSQVPRDIPSGYSFPLGA